MKKLLHYLLLTAIALAMVLATYRVAIGPIRVASLLGGGVDAVSSASVILDKPSGNYVVLLNGARHQKYGTTQSWIDFFGGESLVIMDDVDCMVGDSDAGGIQMAESYRSRLPENQMNVKVENGLMMLSKAELGRFDVIVMSQEFADAFGAASAYDRADVAVIVVDGTETEGGEAL